MATFEKRTLKNGKTSWSVDVRIKGHPSISRSFSKEDEARKWADIMEKGLRDPYQLRPTLNMAIERYKLEIFPTKSKEQQVTLKNHFAFWLEHLGNKFMDEMTPFEVETTANLIFMKINKNTQRMLTEESRRKYLMSLSHLFNVAGRNWKWVKYNPVSLVKRNKTPKERIKIDKVETNLNCPIRREFFQEIKKEMNKKGYTIGSLAHAMNIAKSTIQSLFDPKVNLTVNMMKRICGFLKLRIEIKFYEET